MERVEYWEKENKIGLSIKYPAEIHRKWSERQAELQCSNCDSKNIESDIDEGQDLILIRCLDCPNSWSGEINKVLTWYDTEEATIDLWDKPFSEI